jgi:hypothetical protein
VPLGTRAAWGLYVPPLAPLEARGGPAGTMDPPPAARPMLLPPLASQPKLPAVPTAPAAGTAAGHRAHPWEPLGTVSPPRPPPPPPPSELLLPVQGQLEPAGVHSPLPHTIEELLPASDGGDPAEGEQALGANKSLVLAVSPGKEEENDCADGGNGPVLKGQQEREGWWVARLASRWRKVRRGLAYQLEWNRKQLLALVCCQAACAFLITATGSWITSSLWLALVAGGTGVLVRQLLIEGAVYELDPEKSAMDQEAKVVIVMWALGVMAVFPTVLFAAATVGCSFSPAVPLVVAIWTGNDPTCRVLVVTEISRNWPARGRRTAPPQDGSGSFCLSSRCWCWARFSCGTGARTCSRSTEATICWVYLHTCCCACGSWQCWCAAIALPRPRSCLHVPMV